MLGGQLEEVVDEDQLRDRERLVAVAVDGAEPRGHARVMAEAEAAPQGLLDLVRELRWCLAVHVEGVDRLAVVVAFSVIGETNMPAPRERS